jgi:hypothetical protein
VAALAGHAIISIASVKGRILSSPASVAAVIGLVLVIAGVGQGGLRWAYKAYAKEGYKLGLALRQAAKSGELVVTMAGAVGDPTAIYYSRQRGWVFPPYPSQPPRDDDEAIRLFEGLRTQGADWLGIVAESRDDLWRDYPGLAEHVLSTCELYQDTPDYVIYRILAPEEATLAR